MCTPPQTIAIPSLKFSIKILLPRKNTIPHLSKDFNWRQLKFDSNFLFADELVIFVVLVRLVVLVVLVVCVVLVLSGVQHVDCVTFSTLSCLLNVQSEKEKEEEQKKGKERKRERGRGRWRETRRETGRGRGTEREREEEEGEEEDKDKEKMNYTEARKENDEGKEKEKGQEKEKETKKKKDTVHIKKWLLLYKVAPASDLEKFAATVNPENNLLKWTGPSHGPVPWKFAEKLFFNKGLISGLILLGQGDTQDFFQKKWSCFFAQTCFLTKKNVCQDFLPQWWTFQILLGDWICCFFFPQ